MKLKLIILLLVCLMIATVQGAIITETYYPTYTGSENYTHIKIYTTDSAGSGQTSGTWTVPSGVSSVEVLVVGGGASGGAYAGGGGGGGEVNLSYNVAVTPGSSITVKIGNGGLGVTGVSIGNSGSDTEFGSLIADGGGPGGALSSSSDGGDGGNGGGGAWKNGIGGDATSTTGHKGGNGGGGDGDWGAGGGAGASEDGGNGSTLTGGGGGDGILIWGAYYGGGGGGSVATSGTSGLGSDGGGGAGTVYDSSDSAESGDSGTGGGGGGVGNSTAYSGSGGSGIIIIRYGTPPNAEYTVSSTIANPGTSILFTDESSSAFFPITSWIWSFGDGTYSISQNPTHSYSEVGSYTVSLTVSNAYGNDTETKTDYINIGLPPTAEFSSNLTVTTGFPATIAFTDESSGASSWNWSFGDGTYSTSQNPSHTYNRDGSFTLRLTVTGTYGTDSTSSSITIGHEGYRPKASQHIEPLDESAYDTIIEAIGGSNVVGANETGEPEFKDIAEAGIYPYVSTIGLLFWVVFWGVSISGIWIRQETVAVPSIIGLILGPFMLAFLPQEYHAGAIIFLALSITGIVFLAVTTGRREY